MNRRKIIIFKKVKIKPIKQLEMLARLRALQRDGRRRQADNDFGGWVNTTVLFLVVSGPKFTKVWVGSFQRRLPIVYIMFPAGDIGPQGSKLPLSCEVVENR